jgi:hypothetical protein
VGEIGLFGLIQTTQVSQTVGKTVSEGAVPATFATLVFFKDGKSYWKRAETASFELTPAAHVA